LQINDNKKQKEIRNGMEMGTNKREIEYIKKEKNHNTKDVKIGCKCN